MKVIRVPWGMLGLGRESGDGGCVGPMMKLPLAVGLGRVASGRSVAGTLPWAWGLRVGGVGRGVWAARVAAVSRRMAVRRCMGGSGEWWVAAGGDCG